MAKGNGTKKPPTRAPAKQFSKAPMKAPAKAFTRSAPKAASKPATKGKPVRMAEGGALIPGGQGWQQALQQYRQTGQLPPGIQLPQGWDFPAGRAPQAPQPSSQPPAQVPFGGGGRFQGQMPMGPRMGGNTGIVPPTPRNNGVVPGMPSGGFGNGPLRRKNNGGGMGTGGNLPPTGV